MSTFLQELTQRLLNTYRNDLSSLVVMLPSLRARAFFNDALIQNADTPIWQPQRATIEEIMERGSGLIIGERIRLISELFKIYEKYHPGEKLDRFYFWGDMLISDFDTIDKYMIDAKMLLRNIEDIKELESDISYLNEEQLRIVAFWRSIGDTKDLSKHKQRFLEIWKTLPAIYTKYRERLRAIGIGYGGMLYRETAERIRRGEDIAIDNRRYIIAGFNALSTSEKILFDYLANREAGAEFYWDYDSYYVDKEEHEAGKFLRENIKRYASSFEISHDNILAREKRLRSIGCVSNIVQLKYVSKILESLPAEELDKRTAIVLTDENMLIPLLHSLPECVKKVNITMGYPIKTSLAFTFIERLASLQMHSRKKGEEDIFYHVDVTGILTHPYIRECEGKVAVAIVDHISANRMSSIPSKEFEGSKLLGTIFSRKTDWESMASHLIDVLSSINEKLELGDGAEADSMRLVIENTAMTMRSFKKCDIKPSIEIFLAVLRRHLQRITIPYEGEPLEGVQIMGILETRNIDFKNVIILSMTDATFPGDRTSESSFIPYNLRAAYAMPTPEEHEAMYAYYFYRLIQRAERVDMLYCSRADEKSTGECSRYIHQLNYEIPYTVEKLSVGVDLVPDNVKPIVVKKGEKEMKQLEKYLAKDIKHSLSPTALFRYVQCPLKFYFATLAHLHTPNEISDTVDALTFGSILHDSMFDLYTPLKGERNPMEKISELANYDTVSKAVDRNMGKLLFGREDITAADLSGDRLLVRDIIIKYIIRGIMQHDINRKDYTIKELEKNVPYFHPLSDGRVVTLDGRADRIDELDNRILQIIDYKSGQRPTLEFNGIYNLFNGTPKQRLSEVFQTLLYSMMLKHSSTQATKPSLYFASKMVLGEYDESLVSIIKKNDDTSSDKSDTAKRTVIHNYNQVAEEFEQQVNKMLEDIFNENIPFRQAEDEDMCEYCDFKKICQR